MCVGVCVCARLVGIMLQISSLFYSEFPLKSLHYAQFYIPSVCMGVCVTYTVDYDKFDNVINDTPVVHSNFW